jgi:glycerol-3-phosphate O-acyltransferase
MRAAPMAAGIDPAHGRPGLRERLRTADIRIEWQRFQKDMGRSLFARLFQWLLDQIFSRAELDREDVARIRSAADLGVVLYVARALSRLEFLCWRTVLARADLPLPLAANGLSARASAESFARLLGGGRSVMLFLRRPPGAAAGKTFEGPYEERILDLVRAGEAVVVVPLILVWGTSGVRGWGARGWLENLLGAEDEPGPLRRVLQVVWRRRRAFLRAADPLDLRELVGAEDPDAPVGARRLRFELSGRIERERRIAFGPPLKSGRRIRQEVLRSRRVAHAIAEAAARLGRRRARRRAERLVRDIAADIRPNALRLWRLLVDAVFARMYEGIDVDEPGLVRVRAAAGRGPVVFVPSHRSHIDYLALSYVLHQRGVFPPHIAAGSNLDFFPVGSLFRRGGAFFVRRSPGTDRLYAAVFREYVRRLLRSGFSIEFFIEGGRSRTGKVLEPKLGLLSIIVDAVMEGDVPNLQIVPVSVGYERVLEEASYAAELAGAAKRPEDLSAVLRATRVLASRHGRLDVQFDEPFDLRAVLEERGAREGGARAPLVRVARRIVWGIGRVTAVTPTALVAAALLASGKRQASRVELFAAAAALYRQIVASRARLAPALRGPGGPNETALDRALELLEEDGLVQVRGTTDHPLYEIPEGRRQRLDYYRNNVRQALAGPALVAAAALALTRGRGEPVADADLRGRTLELSRLLESEFVFEPLVRFDEAFDGAVASLAIGGVLAAGSEGLRPIDPATLGLLAGSVRDLLEAYWVAARALDLLEAGGLGGRDWVAKACALGERLYLQRAIGRPEGISRATLHNALSNFRERGIIAEEGGRLHAIRRPDEVAAEISAFLT